MASSSVESWVAKTADDLERSLAGMLVAPSVDQTAAAKVVTSVEPKDGNSAALRAAKTVVVTDATKADTLAGCLAERWVVLKAEHLAAPKVECWAEQRVVEWDYSTAGQ